MTPTSTDRVVPPGSTIILYRSLHTAGLCCQYSHCKWCMNVLHVQHLRDDDFIYGFIEVCESCNFDLFDPPPEDYLSLGDWLLYAD